MRALTGTTSETDGLSLRSHIVTRKLLRLCTDFPGRPKCECFLTHGPCTGGVRAPAAPAFHFATKRLSLLTCTPLSNPVLAYPGLRWASTQAP